MGCIYFETLSTSDNKNNIFLLTQDSENSFKGQGVYYEKYLNK